MDPRKLNQMFELLAPTPEQTQNGLNRLLHERTDHPMKKLKKMTAISIAAALMLVTCAAAVMTGIDQRLIDFLGGGEQAQELLEPGAQPVDIIVEDNGASLHITQVLMDRYSVLVLADFTAPEGTVLDMAEEQEGIRRGFGSGPDLSMSMAYLLDQAGEPLGLGERNYEVTVLDDGDPQDNHLTLLFRLRMDYGIRSDWDIKELFLPAEDLVRYDRKLESEITVYSGDWSCCVPVTRQDMGRTISMNYIVGQTDNVNIMVTDVYLSPMTLQIRLDRETSVSPEESRAEKSVYTHWVSALDFNSVTLTSKDGHAIPLTPLGGIANDQDQNWGFQLEEITDPAQLQTLTLRIGEGSIDIPLDGFADEPIQP